MLKSFTYRTIQEIKKIVELKFVHCDVTVTNH